MNVLRESLREPIVPSIAPIVHQVAGDRHEDTERDKVALSERMKPNSQEDGKTASSKVVREQAGAI